MAAVRGCGFDPRLGTERGRGAAGSGGTELLLRAGGRTGLRFVEKGSGCVCLNVTWGTAGRSVVLFSAAAS